MPVDDEGGTEVKGGEKCTRTWCASNGSKGVKALVSRSGCNTGYEFYDSLLRSRQPQTPSSTGGPGLEARRGMRQT